MTTIHGIVISSGDGLLYEVNWEGGSACSISLMKVHMCIDKAQPEKGLFSNPPRIFPPPPTPPTNSNTCQSLDTHSWHECACTCTCTYTVRVGCEWSYGA